MSGMDNIELARTLFMDAVGAYEAKDYERAERLFRSALGRAPDRVSILVNLSATLIRLGRYDDARMYAERSVSLDEGNPEGWKNLGECFRSQGMDEKAAESFERALLLEPDSGDLHQLLAESYARLGKPERAMVSITRVHVLKEGGADSYADHGFALFEAGQLAEARNATEKALVLNGNLVPAWLNHGLILLALGETDDGVSSLDRAIELDSRSVRARMVRASILVRQGRHEEALADIECARNIDPLNAQVQLGCGEILRAIGRHMEAIEAYDAALRLSRSIGAAWIGRGSSLYAVDRLDEALASYEEAAAIDPTGEAGWLGRGATLEAMGQHAEALASFDRALQINPRLAEAWSNRAKSLLALKQPREALESCDKALDESNHLVPALSNRGIALNRLERFSEALVSFASALDIDPSHTEAWLGRADALDALRRHPEALESIEVALKLSPEHAGCWTSKGMILARLGRYVEAVNSFNRALELDDGNAVCWCAKAVALIESGYTLEALEALDRALELDQGYAEAWINRGHALSTLRRYAEAIDCYQKANKLKPEMDYLAGAWAHAALMLCNWRAAEEIWDALLPDLEKGARKITPSHMLALPAPLMLQRRCTEAFVADRVPAVTIQRPLRRATPFSKRIRVGYLSADLRNHPVGYQVSGLARMHDRLAVQAMAFSMVSAEEDAYQRLFRESFDGFEDLSRLDRTGALDVLERSDLDVLVDLQGHMQGARMELLSAKLAPIQVNFLCPGTSGAPFIDYILADATLIPDRFHAGYSEKVVTLPGSFFVTDYQRIRHGSVADRSNESLPESAFVLACFCESYKITRGIWDVWMSLLHKIPQSVLWLGIRSNSVALDVLKRDAVARGLSAERLITANFVERREDHLARIALADLCLDTPVYNGHTTTADALWAGVPVLTMPGETFCSRVATSILHAARLPELVARDLADYEAIALRLARNPAELGALRARLACDKASLPIFDTERAVRNVETAFRMMVERQRKGLLPESFAVPAG